MALRFLNSGYFAGSVGIGTDSPGAKLEVKSSANLNSFVNITTTTDAYNSGISLRQSSNYGFDVYYTDDGVSPSVRGLHFDRVNNGSVANAMFIDRSSGNVGIGTTNPGEPLTVKTKTDAYFPGIKVEDYDSSMGLYIQNLEGYNSGIGTGRYYNSNFWRSDVTAPTTIRLDGGAIRFYAQSGVTADVNYTPTQRMNIAATGAIKFNAYDSTNQTGTPTYLLGTDASGNIVKTNTVPGSGAGPYLPLAGGTMTGSIDFVNNKDISMTDSAGAITRVMVLNTSNTMYIGPVDTYAGGSILYGAAAGVSFQRFFTGASERLRIGSNGNIAIGTTATSYRLQVEQDNDGNLLSRFHNTAANGQGLLIRAGGVSSANRILQLASENDTKVMTVNSNGRVGIGIANPTEKLEVVGNIKITAALLSNQENTDVDTGTETVASVAIATYTAAFFDFVVKKTTNVRSGTVYACHDGTSVVFTETSTNDLGDTSDVTLSVDISGTNMRLLATVTSDDWSVKSLIRAI